MSEKPVVLVTRKLPLAVEQRLQRDYACRLNEEDRIYGPDEIVERAQGAVGIVACPTEKFTAELIPLLPHSVRVVASVSVGVDHVDLDAAKAHGLIVTNTPEVLDDATAETAMLLLLAAARRAGEGERLVRADRWSSWSPTFMLGVQVSGKRLGIIGMGNIGRIMAKRARGFDMEVHYHNRSRLSPELEQGAVFHADVDEMMPHCDFLSLHCPATPQTRNILNAPRIAAMPDGAVVVNTARGAVVDETALIEALQNGKLAAAGLDVFQNEPKINPVFRELDNVFLLPHIGSATHETRDAMGFRALDNLDAVVAGREPRDRVV